MLGKHMPLRIVGFVMLCIVSDPALTAGKSSYDRALEGKKCQMHTWNQTFSCEYLVGTGLKFAIAGIGQPDTSITFMKSSFNGDFTQPWDCYMAA